MAISRQEGRDPRRKCEKYEDFDYKDCIFGDTCIERQNSFRDVGDLASDIECVKNLTHRKLNYLIIYDHVVAARGNSRLVFQIIRKCIEHGSGTIRLSAWIGFQSKKPVSKLIRMSSASEGARIRAARVWNMCSACTREFRRTPIGSIDSKQTARDARNARDPYAKIATRGKSTNRLTSLTPRTIRCEADAKCQRVRERVINTNPCKGLKYCVE